MRTYKEYGEAGLRLEGHSDWLVLMDVCDLSPFLDKCNFDVCRDLLPDGENVKVHRFGHFNLEILLVRPGTAEHKKAEEIEAAMADYPCLDDRAYAESVDTKISGEWRAMSLSHRVMLCKEVGESVFAARHEGVPIKVYEQERGLL